MKIVSTKPYKGMAMEGIIASWYAGTTKNQEDFKTLPQQLAAQLPPGSEILEVAPGPGYLAIALAQRGFQVTGLDISKSFVEIASKNAAQAGVSAMFQHGNASDMPFPDNSFDFIVCRAAFKNFGDPVGAIREMYRVLRRGGNALIVDMRRDATAQEIEDEVRKMHLNPLNGLVVKWTFHNMLIKSAYTQSEMRAMAAQTPFGTARIEPNAIGMDIWLEK